MPSREITYLQLFGSHQTALQNLAPEDGDWVPGLSHLLDLFPGSIADQAKIDHQLKLQQVM